MQNELISIVMPAHNGEKRIRESVQSVIDQTFCHWELLIIDDGSTDSTRAIVCGFEARDARIRLVALPENQTFANAPTVDKTSS